MNKFLYLWVVQGRYAGCYGWEDLTAEESFKEARARFKEYRENEPTIQHRLIERREVNPQWEHMEVKV